MESQTAKQNSQMVWGATPAGASFAPQLQPGSREFFEQVYQRRSTYEMPWLYNLFSFARWRGRRVLELGCGAGYDAYDFCRNGADYVGVDLTPQNPKRVMDHLKPYDLHPKTINGDAESIMFESNSFDCVFSNGVLHHTPDIQHSFLEAWRVLKVHGEFWVIIYNKYSIFYIFDVVIRKYLLKGGFLKRSLAEQRSFVEYTASDRRPLVNVYSTRQLRKLLTGAGFEVKNIWTRKLVADDLPPIPFVSRRLYPLIPQSALNRLAEIGGWYLVAQACKP